MIIDDDELGIILEFIDSSIARETLLKIVFTNFNDIYSVASSKPHTECKIYVVDYCKRQGRLDKLIAHIIQDNPQGAKPWIEKSNLIARASTRCPGILPFEFVDVNRFDLCNQLNDIKDTFSTENNTPRLLGFAIRRDEKYSYNTDFIEKLCVRITTDVLEMKNAVKVPQISVNNNSLPFETIANIIYRHASLVNPVIIHLQVVDIDILPLWENINNTREPILKNNICVLFDVENNCSLPDTISEIPKPILFGDRDIKNWIEGILKHSWHGQHYQVQNVITWFEFIKKVCAISGKYDAEKVYDHINWVNRVCRSYNATLSIEILWSQLKEWEDSYANTTLC